MTRDAPLGTVTFLLTDVEGSTRLWQHAGDRAAAAMARHDELLAELIEAHGGFRPRDQGEARAEWAERRDVLLENPQDQTWPSAMAMAVEACCGVDDRDGAQRLYEAILPFAPYAMMAGAAIVYFGTAAHYLGKLAHTLGRLDDAVAHLDEAVATHDRIGAAPMLARSRYELARALIARGDPVDEARINELLEQAETAAAGMGMRVVREWASALRAERAAAV